MSSRSPSIDVLSARKLPHLPCWSCRRPPMGYLSPSPCAPRWTSPRKKRYLAPYRTRSIHPASSGPAQVTGEVHALKPFHLSSPPADATSWLLSSPLALGHRVQMGSTAGGRGEEQVMDWYIFRQVRLCKICLTASFSSSVAKSKGSKSLRDRLCSPSYRVLQAGPRICRQG